MILPRARRAAYRRAFYRADAGTGKAIEIRVGWRSPAVDELLAARGKRRWVFLTACNPGAVRLSDAVNRARTRELESALRTRRITFFRGEGGSDAGDWREEESFLALGVSLRAAERLRRRFGQDAFVTGIVGGVARLWPV